MSEFELIDWIRRRVVDRPPLLLGIGDDAAVLAPSDKPLLVTTDLVMEGTDFTFPQTTPQLAGRKSLAVNLSDIAAMAGIPTAAFVSVALPQARGESFAEAFFDGLLDLADEFGVVLAGGDTNAWDKPLVASITMLGYPAGKKAITRSGAKPGDKIFVTGELGGSILGHHLTFTPRIEEARQLVNLVDVHAMIDISDGLAADLHHLLGASNVGAVIQADRIPISAAAQQLVSGERENSKAPRLTVPESTASERLPSALGAPHVLHALSDGEDFELLFTVCAADAEKLQRHWPGPTKLTCLGEITSEIGCWLQGADGAKHPLPPLGWQHRFS
jgi:thiamine-monophosphate kinase